MCINNATKMGRIRHDGEGGKNDRIRRLEKVEKRCVCVGGNLVREGGIEA